MSEKPPDDARAPESISDANVLSPDDAELFELTRDEEPRPVVSASSASPTTAYRGPTRAVRLVQSIWLGAGVFLLMIASAVFRVAGDPDTAANVVGAMLARWHYIALLAPLLLLAMEWKRERPRILMILFVAILFASAEGILDVQIHAMRMQSPMPISSLAPDDPFRRHFGMLHGMSSFLLILQVVCAAARLLSDREVLVERTP